LNYLFSNEFINKFKKVLVRLYEYEEYMNFLIVPSFCGKKTLSYLPLLNYTDRTNKNIEDLLELAKDNNFQIRVLNFDYKEFKENDTVTMRLDIESKKIDDLYSDLKSKRRNLVKKSLQNNFIFKYGNSDLFINDFYTIFSNTMHKHGTPVFDNKFFYYLRDEFKENNIYYIAYNENNKPIASMCILFDEKIVWYPWGGVDENFSKKLAGYFIYWKTLEEVVKKGNFRIFDFGRSSFNGSTYRFKSQFGAEPIKIDIISSQNEDVYSKYSLASSIWKKLPKTFVDFLGPKICKYLEDL
jgi:predicted N-acyltransferase